MLTFQKIRHNLQKFLVKFFLNVFATLYFINTIQAQELEIEGLNNSLNQPLSNVEPEFLEPNNNTNNTNNTNNLSSFLMLEINKALGTPYRMGGNNPTQGLDCSGFVRWVLRHNISLPRTASEMAQIGITISKNNLQHGDLLFFNTRGRSYSHVGIYIGAGRFAHAASQSKRVEISHLDNSYWQKHYQISKRVL